ncbi:MAG: Wzy polymerase domain-containing protein, partial [Rhodoferax sp.]|nr:Wzy polymerase domain-containing protein [Rhodoferax sp.]
GQAYGNLRQRNQFATLLGIGIAAVLWFAVPARFAGQPPSAARLPSTLHPLVWQSSIVLLAVAMAASGSRTGMLQLLLLLALGLVWRRGQGYLLLLLFSYLLAAWLLPLSLGRDPFQSAILSRLGENSAPCSSRLTLWSNVLHLIAQKPWMGWGWGELKYAHFITLYPGARFCEILGNAHNLPLHLAVELGVPVAVLICGSVLGWLLRQKPWREQHATRQLAWMVLAVIGLHSLLEYPLWYGPFQLATVLALWLLWSTPPVCGSAANSVASVPQRRRRRRLAQALAAALLLVCSYIAWDYWRTTQIYLPSYERSAAYKEDTLVKIGASWLFRDSVDFAELGITPLTPANAGHIHALALNMLHFSPESLVLEKLIESARLLGYATEADFYALRYQRAY